jgi:hypothetical protein
VKKIVLSLIVTLVSLIGFVPPASATTGASGSEVVDGVDAGVTWGAVGGVQSPMRDEVYDIKISPTTGEVYFGGLFTNAIDGTGDYIIKYNPETEEFSTLGDDGNAGGALHSGDYCDGYGSTGVWSMVFDSAGILYVTGDFNIDERIYDVAKWDGTSWSGVGPDNTFGIGDCNRGRSIAIDSQDNIYVAGNFYNIGSANGDAIVKWDGENWSALGNTQIGCNETAKACLRALAIGKDDSVYVGGHRVNMFGIQAADYIAKWNGTEWVALGNNGSFDGALRGVVMSLAVDVTGDEDIVYVGHDDDRLRNGDVVGYFIKWDGTQWTQVGPRQIDYDYVRNITITSSGGVLFGGYFNYIQDNSLAAYFGYFDGTETYALGIDSSLDPVFNDTVQALAIDADGRIYAGGNFSDANLDTKADGIAVSSTTDLRPVGVSFGGRTRKTNTSWVGAQSISCPTPNPWVKEQLGFATNAKPVLVSAENTIGKTITQSSYDALRSSGVVFDTVSKKVSTATETLPIYGCKDKLLSGKVNQPIQFIAGGYTLQSDAHGYINTADLKWHDTNGVTLYTNTAAFMHTIKFTKTGKYVVVLTEHPDTSAGISPTYGARSIRFVININ